MKVELSGLLSDARGVLGTTVFQKGKDGIIVRPRVKGTDPQTPAQMAVRTALTKASRDYRNLTPAEVASWKSYAGTLTFHNNVQLGGHKPSAFNAFTELASKIYQIDPTATAPTTPPTSAFGGDSVSITVTAAAGKITFTASGANAANVTTEFLLQPLANANRKPQKNGFRIKGYFAFSSGSLSHDITVPAGYYAAGYRFVNTVTGQTLAPVYLGDVQQVTFALEEGGKNKKAA